MENICSDLFFPERELAEEGNDRTLQNYQGCEISNAFVGTIIGMLGGGELQLSCKKKSINYIPSLIEMPVNLG